MASKFNRVNGRTHRTVSAKAKCKECKRTYTSWKVIGLDERCYACHGVDGNDEAAMIAFIQANQ